MARALAILLFVALVASIALNVVVRRGPRTGTPFEYFPNMVRSVRYNAFEANPNFADGMTLRVPPAGTIPRGLPPLPGASAATPLANPFKADNHDALERGTAVFNTYCVPCHAATGVGDGLVVQHGFPAPPSLLRARTKQMSDAQIFRVITSGTGSMPSYAAQISRDDRWKAIMHLRTLQGGPPPPEAAK